MRYRHIVVSLLFLACISCSSEEEKAQQPPRETAQEAKGHEAAEQIKATLNSAEMARQIEELRNQQIEELLEKQDKDK